MESESELLMPRQKSQEMRIAELEKYRELAIEALERMKALWWKNHLPFGVRSLSVYLL